MTNAWKSEKPTPLKPILYTEAKEAPIPKQRISDRLKTRLKQAILDGEFAPGDRLPPEMALAQAQGVSKISVREALRELEAEGLIEKRRGNRGGSYVARPGSEKMVGVVVDAHLFGGIGAPDLAEFRRILEPELAQLAARRRTREDLGAMAASIAASQACIDAGQPDPELSLEFHRLIANACHNAFISNLMEALTRVFLHIIPKKLDLASAQKDLDYNRAFYHCIKMRNGDRAAAIMADHFDALNTLIKKTPVKNTLEKGSRPKAPRAEDKKNAEGE